jgi:hypothetical protein
MNPQQLREYIIAERAKGTPDAQIYDTIKQQKTRPAPTTTTPNQAQRGFWGEVLPSAFAVGGSIIGGIGGAVAGPAGAVAGAIGGAAAGGAIGEGIQQNIEQSTGMRDASDPAQVLATGVISGGTQALGAGAAKLAVTAAKPVINAARQPALKFFKWASGYSEEVIERALQRTEGAVATTKAGEPALDDIIRQTAVKLNEHAKETLAASKAKIAELSKTSVGGPGELAEREAILDRGTNFISNITAGLRGEHNIGVRADGTLLFDRASLPSRIVSGGDRSAIQSAFATLKSVENDTTIKNIDAVMERLIALRAKTPAGSPTGPETRAIIGQMITSVRNFAESLEDMAPAYKQYVEFIDDNIPKRMMIDEAKEFFGGSAHLSPKQVSQISVRLLQLFNSGRTALKEGVENVATELGTDPVGGAAGVLTHGFAASQRAPNLSTRGFIERAVEFLPRTALQTYIKTGKITGDLLDHPKVKALATVLGTSSKFLLQEIANLTSNKTSN